MRRISFLSILFSFVFLASCSKDDDKISFTFLQVNDVYEIAPIQGGKYGGMARLETIHQNLKQENPNTMLVMAGDFLNPSLLGTMKYEGDRIRGKQMVEVMNAMDFELVAFGNHEFDLSNKDLQKRMNESEFQWISANVMNQLDNEVAPFHRMVDGKKEPIKGSYIKEISDEDGTKIKIGFISVCIPSNPKSYVKYSDMYEEIQKEYNAIKDQADVVFGLTHVTIVQDKKIAKLLPELPLIMGGHEHTYKDEKVGNTLIKKADANAKTAYIHRIEYDKKTGKSTITSELKEINSEIQEDTELKKIVDKWQDILNKQISKVVENPFEVVHTTDEPLDGRDTPIRSVQTNLGALIAKSMHHAYKGEVVCAFVNGGSIRIDDELVGDINSVDIFRVLPYGGSVFKVTMKGSLLEQVLDYGNNAAGTGAHLQRHLVESKDGEWFVDGKRIAPKKNYTVALSDYLMRGLDIPILHEKNPEVIAVYKPKEGESAYDIRKAVIDYLKSQ